MVGRQAITRILVGGAVAGGALVAAVVTGGPGPAPSGTAQLWVDTNGGSCTRQASPAAYSDPQACGSFQAAIAAASPGDTVRVVAGTYPAQSITATQSSPGVTVIGESKSRVVIPAAPITTQNCDNGYGLSTGGAWYTLQDITVDAGTAHGRCNWFSSGSNITLKNVDTIGTYASNYIGGGSNLTWDGGQWGPVGATSGGARTCASFPNDGGEPNWIEAATNVTIQNVTFWPTAADHTACPTSSNGDHVEMWRIEYGINGLTLRNNVFKDGSGASTATVFVTNRSPGSQPNPQNLTFENNYFGSDGNTSLNLGYCTNVTFSYNTFNNALGNGDATCTGTQSSTTWRGNVGERPSYYTCAGTHDHNVWQWDSSYTCGTDTIATGTQWSLSATGVTAGSDGHISSSAFVRGKGSTTCPATDADGDTRPNPIGSACDAGRDEVS